MTAIVHVPKPALGALALLLFAGCTHTQPQPYSPQDALHAGLRTLPRRGVVAVTLSPEQFGSKVAARLWPGLFTLLSRLTPAPYLADSELELLGTIEVLGPSRASAGGAPDAPAFHYTVTLRRHTPTGRCVALVSGSEEHASFPYEGASLLEWYNRVLLPGA